jgi:hypothetical protein
LRAEQFRPLILAVVEPPAPLGPRSLAFDLESVRLVASVKQRFDDPVARIY